MFANILLGPLKRLAKPIAALAAPGALVVLSGLLPSQANAALAAYRAHGLVLERRIPLDGWMTYSCGATSARAAAASTTPGIVRPAASPPRLALMNETTARPFHAEFQTFDDPPEAAAAAPRVAALRAELARRGLDGFVVPHADGHQNEYLPPSEERLAWLTGFTGSAGARRDPRRHGGAVRRRPLHRSRRATRSTAQLFAIEHLVEKPPSAWIEANLRAGQKLGYDPWLHTERGRGPPRQGVRGRRRHAGRDRRPIRSTRSGTTARRRPTARWCRTACEFAGEAAADKLARIRAEIAKLKADALVVSDPHAVAWTFNIRGADVSHTPLPLAFAIIPAEGEARLYIDGRTA